HLNLSLAKTRADGAEAFSGIILEGPDPWPVRPVAEAFYDRAIGGSPTTSVLGGAIWRVGDELSLDAAARWVRTDGANGFEVRAGFTWALPRLPQVLANGG